ncbi:urease accessory protein UreD [Cylindrospermopsis curvispora]|uniref:Urease accessory protein UreD n=1 Tax=Cylindrospermopsis curvispora GIHE-G1 TaxID=2666332 RepID=A0A7H0EWC9_9CYAN|nr:urease accessory protein UreD [Cylindrospermopsis curvispora]QNP28095.1 urease accessory protein UreD [Cylindrospermopsis curvispora GIHE-G1]
MDNQENSWHGKLELVYAQRQNSTQLMFSHNQAPLKVQRPFYPEGEKICHSVILHTAGGVVAGDRLSSKIHLQSETDVLITTAAANKIYRSNGLYAKQTVSIQIDRGSCLEYLPQETIVFNGGKYRQDVRIELGEGGSFIGWEISRLGRTARGEKFVEGEILSHTEIWQGEVPLWIDRQYIPGGVEAFYNPHSLKGNPVIGSFVCVGLPISEERIEKSRSGIANGWDAGVTRLEQGMLCRYRGSSTSWVRNWFTNVWQDLRQSLLNRGNCIPRVWQITRR